MYILKCKDYAVFSGTPVLVPDILLILLEYTEKASLSETYTPLLIRACFILALVVFSLFNSVTIFTGTLSISGSSGSPDSSSGVKVTGSSPTIGGDSFFVSISIYHSATYIL